MKEFYVQLMSNASKTEFPSNAANSFKTRLPYPLQFKEQGWKVGLVSASYPTPPLHLHQTHTFEPDDLICRFSWVLKAWIKDNHGKDVIAFFNQQVVIKGQDLIDDPHKITGGKSLMAYIVYRLNRQLTLLESSPGQSLRASNGKRYYPLIQWDGDQLFINNRYTIVNPNVSANEKRPEILFGRKLVEAMNWLLKDQNGNWDLHGNLVKEMPSDKTPDGPIPLDWQKGSDINNWSDFWIYTNEGLRLSVFCNWRFYYLDEAYQKTFGVGSALPNRSPLYIYSDVGQSMVMGNQVTDLLREIPHDPTRMTYEPRHVLYLPVRVDVMDIIETQVAENDGTLVEFASGVTTITLHFKYE